MLLERLGQNSPRHRRPVYPTKKHTGNAISQPDRKWLTHKCEPSAAAATVNAFFTAAIEFNFVYIRGTKPITTASTGLATTSHEVGRRLTKELTECTKPLISAALPSYCWCWQCGDETILSRRGSVGRYCGRKLGAGGGNRTHGLGIMRPSLYH